MVRERKPKTKTEPTTRDISQGPNIPSGGVAAKENPNDYYQKSPSWVFYLADRQEWAINADVFWKDILPKMKSFETRKWRDILPKDKKNNHSIKIEDLTAKAIRRAGELHIEAESIISLRFGGRQRLYGIIVGGAFQILWYDPDHGDNNQCVCRSHKKHT